MGVETALGVLGWPVVNVLAAALAVLVVVLVARVLLGVAWRFVAAAALVVAAVYLVLFGV